MEHLSTRQHVVDMCRTMLDRGYLKATEGNVSVRVPGRRLYAVTPSNYSYDRMRVEDVCIVDFDGKHVPDDDRAGASLAPSIECGMHAGIYRQRPDVHAVVHTHQPYASALAVLRRPIPALTDEQVRFLGREVAIIDYAPSGTGFLAKNVQKKVTSGDNAFIIANHGIVAVGTDPDRAVFNMALLEKVSIAYLLALTTESGKVVHDPGADPRDRLRQAARDEKRIAAQITRSVPVRRSWWTRRCRARTRQPRGGRRTRAVAVAEPGRRPRRPAPSPPGSATRSATYPDVDDTMARLRALVDQPVRGLRHDALYDVLEWFETKCQASKELTDRAKARIPGGVQHNLAFNHPFPLAIDRAEGAHLTDRDGNVYIDFLQAGGPTILGSNYAPGQRARRRGHPGLRPRDRAVPRVRAQARRVDPPLHAAHRDVPLARVGHGGRHGGGPGGPGVHGPEVVDQGRRCLPRLVRHAGLRPAGARHLPHERQGHPLRGDQCDEGDVPARPRRPAPQARREPAARRHGGSRPRAARPESGTRPVPEDFNARVRELCDEFGALLVFDEVVTGFRVGMGGAAGYFGVTPDLTVLGKAVAGGYPMAGGVGGREDVMAVFGSGLDGKSGAHIQVGGTLSANPLSCAAGYFAIEEMARTNAPVVAGRAGDRLAAGLERLVAKHALPYVVYNQGSIVHLECSGVMLLDMHNPVKLFKENKPRKRLMEQMGAAYAANGIITLAGSRMYTSMADTDAVIDDALERFDRVFSMVDGV